MMICEKEVDSYLQIVRELKSRYTFFDVHVHPFEIIFNSFDYRPNPTLEGLYSIHHTLFRHPQVTALRLESALGSKAIPSAHWRPGISLINLRRIYCHTGPNVFSDHMELSGIDRVLLLPVASSNDGIDKDMDAMAEMFGSDHRFSFACSVPNTIENREICKFMQEKTNRFKLKAIKLHPNITETDLGSRRGKERVECILEACREFKLPLIVHGGRSSVLKNPQAAEYGWIGNFRDIDWGISSEAVVISHAGGYGCDLNEMEQEVLPTLKHLLSHYINLMIDISGLETDSLAVILRHIDSERILFGSDALYDPQWAVMVKLAHTIARERMNLAETIVQIASRNPLAYIFK